MTFEEAYQTYLLLAEDNGTTDNLSTDKNRFAVKYNIYQNRVIEWLIEANSSDENRYLQSIKIPNKKLELKDSQDDYTSFTIPSDYFEFINLKVMGSKDNCTEQLFKSSEIKGENVYTHYIDPNLDPSFKYRETFYTIESDAVQVYKKEFSINDVEMSYYRKPKQIELEYPDNPESNFKEDILDFDDKLINRIIFSTVALHELSSNDPKFSAYKQETIQKF